MINDAQVGDKPAVENDAQVLSDRPLPPDQEEKAVEAAPKPQAVGASSAVETDAEKGRSRPSKGSAPKE